MVGVVIIGAADRGILRKIIVIFIVFLLSSGSVILYNALKKGDLAEKIILQKNNTMIRTFTPLDKIPDSKSRQDYLTGFTGKGKGFVGDIEVMVFFESENASMEVVMTKIEIIKSEEIRAKWLLAKKKIIEKVLSSQSLDVDVVTGATASSKGLLEAIKDARKKAKTKGHY